MVFGVIVLLTAWLPMVLRELPLSLPIMCIAFGAGLSWSIFSPIMEDNPLSDGELTLRLTELVVIVALFGAGLKVDRPMGWRGWMVAWRLLGVAMPLTILGISLLGWGMLGLAPASALLLGAALAPTDPVLASDVQLAPPHEGAEDEVRFALTAEAGLNDGLSFPFVYLAIALALSQETGAPWFRDWVLVDVLWRLAAGVGVGWITGWLLGYATFRLPRRATLSRTGDGFVALGITCLAYALTELAHGYGFVGVFVAALTLRRSEREHRYHTELHAFAEQVERLLMMLLLVWFGAAIAKGSIFGALTWPVVGVTALTVLVVRPIAAWISLAGGGQSPGERAMIAFFGIRGLGSFYYLAFAVSHADFDRPETLWVTVCLVVLTSIVLHGVTVTPAMRLLDRQRSASEGNKETKGAR